MINLSSFPQRVKYCLVIVRVTTCHKSIVQHISLLSQLETNVKHFHFDEILAHRKQKERLSLYSIESVIMLTSCSTRGEERLRRTSVQKKKKRRLLRIVKRVESLVDPLVGAVIRGKDNLCLESSRFNRIILGQIVAELQQDEPDFLFHANLFVSLSIRFRSSSMIELIPFFFFPKHLILVLAPRNRGISTLFTSKKRLKKGEERGTRSKLFWSSKNLRNIGFFSSIFLLFR